MKHREKQKREWNRIQFTTKKRGSVAVDRIGIPVGYESATTEEIWNYLQTPGVNLTWTYITDQNDIKSRLIEWRNFHYAQAGETPFDSK